MAMDAHPPGPAATTDADAQYAPAGHSFRSITEKISSIVLTRPAGLAWRILFAVSLF